MILNEVTGSVEVNGVQSQKAFRIAANPKAFDLLSSNIYTHKVRAIIREISCNAHDAHTDNKVEQPFYVHLPTTLEPYFSVRDYGRGLSHEDMEDIYTGYFVSTKTHSNELIGALGLGSKSPFCLVDSFMVTSYNGGKKRTYSCFRGEDRTPQISLMSEEDTEETGIEVTVTIEGRSAEFQNETVNVFKYFDRLPTFNIKGIQESIEKEKSRYTLVGEDFAFTGSYGSLVALMGNVAYNIPSEMNKLDLEGYIRFNIGELSFDPGRENLSLDAKTKLAIESRTGKIRETIKQRISVELDAMSKWDQIHRYDEIAHGPMRRICEGMKEYEIPRCSTPIEVYSRYHRKCEKDVTHILPLRAIYLWKGPGLSRRIKSYVLNSPNPVKIVLITPEQALEIELDNNKIQDGKTFLPKVSESTGSREKFDGYRWNGRTSNSKVAWDKVTIDADTEGCYVIVDRLQPVDTTLSEMNAIVSRIGKVSVYGFTQKFVDSPKFDKDQWTPLKEHAREQLKSKAPKAYHIFRGRSWEAQNFCRVAKYSNIPELLEFAEAYSLVERMDHFYLTLFNIPVDTSADELMKKLLDKFPILDMIEHVEGKQAEIVAKTLEILNDSSKEETSEECGSPEEVAIS